MLVAYGPDNKTVVASETPLEQLQHWSQERLLSCPNCRGILHVRGGTERVQMHFAHQKGECAWSTEAESLRHAQGKTMLANWLREQYPRAIITLEERLPEPNRIADIYVRHDNGQQWAIEFQCAPLDIAEWQRRHHAYRSAGIIDTWIIGNNRRDKQEAFIEAIISEMREVMFLDPLVNPQRIWLRWPIAREKVQAWQPQSAVESISMVGWVGRLRYGATLTGHLRDVSLTDQCRLLHPERSALEQQTSLMQRMSEASAVDEATLAVYMRERIDERAWKLVILPLTRAYLRDPDLLRRYNFGRGLNGVQVSKDDAQRIERAKQWLATLSQQGFTAEKLRELARMIPFVGPYGGLANYIEMLVSLA